MTSLGSQVDAARAAGAATASLDTQARLAVQAVLTTWLSLEHPSLANGFPEVEKMIRAVYHTSAAVARAHLSNEIALQGWQPPMEKRATSYLRSLLDDAQNAMRDYLRSPKDDLTRRRVLMRVGHSAGVASQRGYTDATLRSAASLDKAGHVLRKVWVAQFVNNTPCPECRRLHGTEVGPTEQFDAGPSSRVYRDLNGPPRHPRCRCKIVLLLVGADNANEKLDLDKPAPDTVTEMTTGTVQKMTTEVFTALTKALGRLRRFLLRRAHLGLPAAPDTHPVATAATVAVVAAVVIAHKDHEAGRVMFDSLDAAASGLLLTLAYARTCSEKFTFSPLDAQQILQTGLRLEGQTNKIRDILETVPGALWYSD